MRTALVFALAALPAAALGQAWSAQEGARTALATHGDVFHLWNSGASVRRLLPGEAGAAWRAPLPLFAMPAAGAARAGFDLGGGRQVSLTILTDLGRTGDAWSAVPFARRSLATLAVAQHGGAFDFTATAGVLRERASALSAAQPGLLVAGLDNRTVFATVGVRHGLVRAGGRSLDLIGMVAGARTRVAPGVANQAPLAVTGSWSVSAGLAARGLLVPDDRASFMVTVPMRVQESLLGLPAPLPLADGSASLAMRNFAVRPVAGEHDLEMTYTRRTGRDSLVSGGALLRLSPGSAPGARSEVLLGVRFSRGF
jgi:hypothetical protein